MYIKTCQNRKRFMGYRFCRTFGRPFPSSRNYCTISVQFRRYNAVTFYAQFCVPFKFSLRFDRVFFWIFFELYTARGN